MSVNTVESICSKFLGSQNITLLKGEIEKKYQKELFKLEYQKALFEKCTQMQTLSDEELIVLAKARAETLTNYLIQTKNIEKSRVVKEEIKARSDSKEKWVKSTLKIEIK